MVLAADVIEDLSKYKSMVEALEDGSVDRDKEFKPYRLVHGIYGQRQDGFGQMIRIKLKWGRLNPSMMRCLADISSRSGSGILHITTRQAIQVHFIPLEDTVWIREDLEKHEMTSREACGNAVRGVVCSPLSGTLDDEPFDCQPYAEQVFDHFLRGPRSADLPRKFKIALTASYKDTQAFNNIQDIGVLAVEKDGKQGFRIRAAGALGSSPQAPIELYDCLAKEDLIPVCDAILRVHHKYGDRQNRARARLKFVLRDHGDEGFIKLFEEQLAEVRAEGIAGAVLEDAFASAANPSEIPSVADADEQKWRTFSVTPHRDAGYAVVAINTPLGDITADQMPVFADLSEKFTDGDVAVSVDQNLYFRRVAIDKISELYQELVTFGFSKPANTILDVLSCPGASTCQLGITYSKNMAAELADKLVEIGANENVMRARIKMSGCPNSCGQHHIGNIGLHGAAAKIGDKLVPHYVLLVGGEDSVEAVHHANMVARIPAKKVVDAIGALAAWYTDEGQDDETFAQYLRRISGANVEDKKEGRKIRKALRERLTPIYDIDPSSMDESFLYDIGKDSVFNMDDIGAGECMS
ncbi:MAG: nitrite/sulfite reductase [Planctomycetes bacterium]|nr:nitrite/sulfite reductase [Planctomycetota bacterium]